MKVKYVTARPHKGKGSDPSFTLGRTYLVLGVRFKVAAELTEIIVRRDSDAAPVLAELRHFSVVDPAVPPISTNQSFQNTKMHFNIFKARRILCLIIQPGRW